MNRQWKGIFPRDGHFDWPMGLEAGGELVPGFRLRVMQNFHNLDGPAISTTNTACKDGFAYTCGRAHAGVDLALTEGDTAGSLVDAAADGVVECVTAPYPGRVVVIRHDNPDGSTVYSQYGHLTECVPVPDVESCPAPGDRVDRTSP